MWKVFVVITLSQGNTISVPLTTAFTTQGQCIINIGWSEGAAAGDHLHHAWELGLKPVSYEVKCVNTASK